LIKNISNNNGNVGVFGISYPGFYSTMAALSGHPALKAVSPQAPVTDWFKGATFTTTVFCSSWMHFRFMQEVLVTRGQRRQ
jgi:Predicted acyl esterases